MTRKSKHAWTAVSGLAFVLSSQAAIAAGPAPELHQPLVDEFGLDRKIGRILTPTPEQITVGGEGPQKISVAYLPVSPGRPGSQDFASMNSLDMRQVGHIFVNRTTGFDGGLPIEYYTIQYPEGSATFRRYTATGGAFAAEYPNGGTLVPTANGVKFTDRNGITLETNANAANDTVLTYPDGRQLFYNVASLNGLQFSWHGVSISNNFGFALKSQVATDGMRTLAVNRAADICSPSAASCTGLSKDRHSVVTVISNDVRTYHDAKGGITRYRSIPIQAKTEKYYCYWGGSYTICNSPFLVARYYPAGIAFPQNSAESLTIAYSNPDSHADVGVSSIIKDGTTVTYVQQRAIYGSYSSSPNPNTLPYKMTIRSTISGSPLSFTQSDTGFMSWGGTRGALNFVEDGLGKRTTFGANYLGEISSTNLPEGNGQRYEYDTRWNVKAVYDVPKTGSGFGELLTQYVYPASCSAATQAYCNKPTAVIDRRGKQTDYTYNTKGQILTETGPADSAGIRPTTTYEFTARTAYIKDASGNPVAAGLPISLLTKKTECRSLQSCVGTADAVVTEYDYGPTTGFNNLLLRGVAVAAANEQGQIQTLRTCYQYNYFGEKIAETQPNAGVTSCS